MTITDDGYVIYLPQISSVIIEPQIVATGQSFTITVKAAMIQKILQPEFYYSGEIYSNEV